MVQPFEGRGQVPALLVGEVGQEEVDLGRSIGTGGHALQDALGLQVVAKFREQGGSHELEARVLPWSLLIVVKGFGWLVELEGDVDEAQHNVLGRVGRLQEFLVG